MRATALLTVLMLTAGLAGCIGETGGDDLGTSSTPPTTADLVDPLTALENGDRQANIELLSEWRNGNAQEADVWGDMLAVDVGSTIHLLDVSEPGKIEALGSWSGAATPVDVKFSQDGRFLFVGDDAEGSTDELGGTGPLTGGVYVLDITDPATPEQVSFEPVGPQRGPHMVSSLATSAGDLLVLAAAGPDVVIHTFDPTSGELTEVSRYTPGQLAQDRDPNRIGALYNPQGWLHDMFAMEEDDGQVLMYVAAWDAGLRIVDITDPASPEELGSWSAFGENEAGNLHTVVTDWVGDRRITVGSVEVGFAVVGGTYYATGTEKPVVYVWDTTDPASPELLGTWVNPIMDRSGRDYVMDPTGTGLLPEEEVTSPHNLQVEEGRVYLAHYDLGAWVLDISTPANQSQPVALGYYNETSMHTWDVVLHEGVLYTSGQAGLLGLGFALDEVGTGLTSRA